MKLTMLTVAAAAAAAHILPVLGHDVEANNLMSIFHATATRGSSSMRGNRAVDDSNNDIPATTPARRRRTQGDSDQPSNTSTGETGEQDDDAAAANVNQTKEDWWDLGMTDDILNEVGLYYLGQAWHQAADVGEVLETMSRVQPENASSWYLEFLQTANRMESLGEESLKNGHHRTAGQSFLREATYRRAALHRHPDPFAPEVATQSGEAVAAFERFLNETNYPCQPVKIPYEDDYYLPAYLCLNPNAKGPAPTILFNEGKDGWAEDGKFGVDECMARGYHAVLWDGPGMGKVIRLQGLPFRHDWENVVTPLVDYLVDLEEVDEENLAMISVSLGGYLGPHALAFEHRIKALIANPGVMDWSLTYKIFLDEIDPNLWGLVDSDPEAFDAYIYQAMEFSGLMKWGMIDSMWHHNQSTPHDLILEIRKFTNEDVSDKITSHTMVVDAEMETRGSSMDLYNALTNAASRTYVMMTSEEAAQLHVQPGATAILTLKMFDWLDGILLVQNEDRAGGTSHPNSDTGDEENSSSGASPDCQGLSRGLLLFGFAMLAFTTI